MIAKFLGETRPMCLTHNKEYNVISVEDGLFRIVDDSDEDYLYGQELFEVVDDNMDGVEVKYIASNPKELKELGLHVW